MSIKSNEKDLAKEARNKYQREYYQKEENKQKRKEYMQRYWAKKAKEMQEGEK